MAAKHPTRWAARARDYAGVRRKRRLRILPADADLCDNGLPRELAKTSLPPYTIEPPDILLIDALR